MPPTPSPTYERMRDTIAKRMRMSHMVGGEELCRQRLDAFHMQRGEEVACLLIEKPAASCTAAATCQFFKRSSTARIRLGRD